MTFAVIAATVAVAIIIVLILVTLRAPGKRWWQVL